MAKRKSISKSVRFEVFKRDSFACKYCGRKAPEVLLVIDHIEPVSKGGTNDILNLITACVDCNSGKGNKKLSETTILDKRRKQLEELQERKEQLEMIFKWQKGLFDLDEQVIEQLSNYWSEQVPGYHLNDSGLKGLKKLKRRFDINEIMEAMKISTEQYLVFENDSPTKDSVELAWSKVGGICRVEREAKKNPVIKDIYYIRGILRNRMYVNENYVMDLLKNAVSSGVYVEEIKNLASTARNWTDFRTEVEDLIESADDSE